MEFFLENRFHLFSKNKILFANSNIKKTKFSYLFSMNKKTSTLITIRKFSKYFSSFQLLIEYPIKINHSKHIIFVFKNNLFIKQILKSLSIFFYSKHVL